MDAPTDLAKNITPELLGDDQTFFQNEGLQEKLKFKMRNKMPGEGKSNIMQRMLTEIDNPEDLSTQKKDDAKSGNLEDTFYPTHFSPGCHNV